MKTKITMLVVLIFAGTISTYAQQGMQRRTVEERVKSAMDKILDPLKLDKAQQDKTQDIFTEYYTSQDKLREDTRASGTRPDRSVREKLANDRDDKLKSIFTDDQFQKFKSDIESTLRPQRSQGTQSSNN